MMNNTNKMLGKPFRPPFKVPGPAPGMSNVTNNETKEKPIIPKTKEISEKVDENNSQKTETGGINSYFEIFYTKDIKKKTKSFNDGFLELSRQKIKVYDSDGNDIYFTSRGRFFKDTPKPDEEYSLGPYLRIFMFFLNHL